MAPTSITCPQCGLESFHPVDVAERYCGACHQWHDLMGEVSAPVLVDVDAEGDPVAFELPWQAQSGPRVWLLELLLPLRRRPPLQG